MTTAPISIQVHWACVIPAAWIWSMFFDSDWIS